MQNCKLNYSFIFCFFSLFLIFNNAHALFEDSDARREIIKIREQLKTLDNKISETLDKLDTSKQGRLELLNSLEVLSRELSQFRGYTERDQQNTSSIEDRLEKLEYMVSDLTDRLSLLEPKPVSVLGEQLMVKDEEKEMYEKATERMSDGEFDVAAQLFSRFNKKFPDSSLSAYALHSEGAAYYVLKKYEKAIKKLTKLESDYLDYPKMPDALLTLAACQTEMKRSTEAKRTLKKILKHSPTSDAALTAKERLKQLSNS